MKPRLAAANWGAEFAAAPPVVAPLQPHEFAELEKYYQAPAQTGAARCRGRAAPLDAMECTHAAPRTFAGDFGWVQPR